MNTKSKKLENISILCNGSRGDFQPYLALGVELKKAGYNIRILTDIAFKEYTEDFNIQHVTIWDRSYEKDLKQNGELLELMAEGNPEKMFKSDAKHIKEDAPSVCKAMLEEVANHRPDIFIIGSFGEYFRFYVKLFWGIPTLDFKLQSFVCTSERAPLGIPTLPNGGHFDIVMKIIARYYDSMAPYDDVMTSMNQPSLSSIFPKESYLKFIKNLISGHPKKIAMVSQSTLFKEILAPESNEKLAFIGPSALDANQQKKSASYFGGNAVQSKIEKFVSEDPLNKPVYCGWGSMICKSPGYMVEFAIRSLQISHNRGVVQGGFAGLSMDLLKQTTFDQELIEYAEKKVLFIENASHENIFPLMSCIVHHGGSGTTNTVLRCGIPSIVTPVFGDQFDHAYVVDKLGVGIGFDKQFQGTTAEELGEAITNVVGNIKIQHHAKEVQTKILKENGKERAISIIQEYWDNEISNKSITEIKSEEF